MHAGGTPPAGSTGATAAGAIAVVADGILLPERALPVVAHADNKDELYGAPPAPPAADPPQAASPSPTLPPDIRLRWVEFERATSTTLVLIAVLAVLAASVLGFLLADRVLRPLRRLGEAAAAVAGGDLSRRSGLGTRHDEVGELGRSFDTMASALQASDEQRRRFLQDVVHELRTPLTVIDATSSAMLDGVYPLAVDHVATIREQAHLLAHIVDDLRTLNLAEVGKLPLALETVDTAAILSATSTAFAARAVAGGQRMAVQVDGACAVRGDPDRLRQILAGLVDNALNHTPAGGEVRLRARGVGGSCRFEIEDTGAGVAASDLPRIFDRFYEADPARDRAHGHTGLGLAIVKALVQAHGGRVGVENVPGAGARFWFELPHATASADTTTAVAGRDGG